MAAILPATPSTLLSHQATAIPHHNGEVVRVALAPEYIDSGRHSEDMLRDAQKSSPRRTLTTCAELYKFCWRRKAGRGKDPVAEALKEQHRRFYSHHKLSDKLTRYVPPEAEQRP